MVLKSIYLTRGDLHRCTVPLVVVMIPLLPSLSSMKGLTPTWVAVILLVVHHYTKLLFMGIFKLYNVCWTLEPMLICILKSLGHHCKQLVLKDIFSWSSC